jgi:hypothetical protein
MVIEIFQLPKRGAHGMSFLKKKIILPPIPSWVTKKFQSQYNGGGVSNGNQIFSITI